MFILTAQQTTSSDGSMGTIAMLVWLAICATVIAGVWRVFTKAGEPGWGVLIPIYNFYLLCRIAQRPGWWLILMFIPVVNLAVGIVLSIDIARHFGKGAGFGVGLAFLGIVFYPILGFGSAEYGSASGEFPAATIDPPADQQQAA